MDAADEDHDRAHLERVVDVAARDVESVVEVAHVLTGNFMAAVDALRLAEGSEERVPLDVRIRERDQALPGRAARGRP